MINFKGKIILPQVNFINNVQYLQKILKKNGYDKRNNRDFEQGNWIAML